MGRDSVSKYNNFITFRLFWYVFKFSVIRNYCVLFINKSTKLAWFEFKNHSEPDNLPNRDLLYLTIHII